jgi:hypothetical protein
MLAKVNRADSRSLANHEQCALCGAWRTENHFVSVALTAQAMATDRVIGCAVRNFVAIIETP